jgi:hypothetical protein
MIKPLFTKPSAFDPGEQIGRTAWGSTIGYLR